MLIIRRSKFYYRASGVVIPVGDRPVHRLREDCSHLSTAIFMLTVLKTSSPILMLICSCSESLTKLTFNQNSSVRTVTSLRAVQPWNCGSMPDSGKWFLFQNVRNGFAAQTAFFFQ